MWAVHSVCDGLRRVITGKRGGKARAGSALEPVDSSVVIVNALLWPTTQGVLTSLNPARKILLDCCNPLFPDLSGVEIGTASSGGEFVARWRIPFTAAARFRCSNGDDAEAKKTAAPLAGDTGFEPIDAGSLSNSRLLEPLAMFRIRLAYKCGMGREFAFTLLKR
jgi:predicted dinucleotide-binding enzyme